MLKFKIFILSLSLFVSSSLWAQKKYPYSFPTTPTSARVDDSKITYDISASFGEQNGNSYQEINLGLNWTMNSFLNWRNSLFTRMGQSVDAVSGLDSSLRLQLTSLTDDQSFGFHAFAGPGVRLATQNWNAAFGEAGLIFKLGGIQLGAGVKSIQYFESRADKNKNPLPKNEQQVFIILSGGGTL
ncbi:MAG: hypothetical protein JNL11_11145 [Bdellovibrionaceae bacterium]|nr:hypothetical protein [Pseudobdellovibrionaceae bacterium]